MGKLRILLLATIPAAAWGQAMVEYGLGAAAAGTAGAGGVGRGMSGIFNSLSKTLGTATEGQTGAAATTQSTRTATSKAKAGAAQPAVTSATALPAEPPKPAVVYEDPAGIAMGMGWDELLGRFGEPAMKVTSGAASESLTYETKERSVDVEMRAGKVYSLKVKNRIRQSAAVNVK